MRTSKIIATILVAALIFSTNALGGESHSGRAIADLGKASTHASAGAGHAIVGSGQAISAIASVPFALVGSVGAVSSEIAKDLLNAATAPVGTPLEITDETVSAGPPPNEALAPM